MSDYGKIQFNDLYASISLSGGSGWDELTQISAGVSVVAAVVLYPVAQGISKGVAAIAVALSAEVPIWRSKVFFNIKTGGRQRSCV